MPTYPYACTECGHAFEIHQSFSDPSLTECPECSGRLRKVYSSVGVVFKGSGFYRTDSRAGSVPAGSAAGSGASDGGGSGGSDTKAAATSDGAKSDSAKSDGGKSAGGTSAGAAAKAPGATSAKPAPAAVSS